jgi:hypothetical protein
MFGWIKKAFIPVAAVVGAGVLYFNNPTVKVASLALANPGTSLVLLAICTDPLVVRLTGNLIYMCLRVLDNYI